MRTTADMAEAVATRLKAAGFACSNTSSAFGSHYINFDINENESKQIRVANHASNPANGSCDLYLRIDDKSGWESYLYNFIKECGGEPDPILKGLVTKAKNKLIKEEERRKKIIEDQQKINQERQKEYQEKLDKEVKNLVDLFLKNQSAERAIQEANLKAKGWSISSRKDIVAAFRAAIAN